MIAFSQDQVQANLFETVNIHVKPGQEKAFEAAVKAHNMKYHPEDGDYHGRLFYNINGPIGGAYSYIMGPTSWTAMDSRPTGSDHDNDWAKVVAMTEKIESPVYWSFSEVLSNEVENISPSKRMIWMYDLKNGQEARWAELVGKVKEVYKAKRPTEPFWVLWNEFANTEAGMDAVIIFAFDKWSWLDRKNNFAKEYEEVHGEGSWHTFLNAFSETVNGRVDWLRERVN
jgi:hypothetical protein